MSRNGKSAIELTSNDAQGNQTMRIEISSDNPDEIDRIRRKVAKLLIDEWALIADERLTNEEPTENA